MIHRTVDIYNYIQYDKIDDIDIGIYNVKKNYIGIEL